MTPRDHSGNLYQQFIHGTQYIDELVMVRVKDKGDLYVHQDANWNVIGLTDLGGHLVERYVLTPYGEVTVYQETGPGDYDGDSDVDSTDRAAGEAGGACRGSNPSASCRALDLDFDNDVDDSDLTLFDSLPQGLARHPGRIATAVHQPFAHQALLFEPELGQYQNRARQYDPAKRRFAQRDYLGLLGTTFCTGSLSRSMLQQYINWVIQYDPDLLLLLRREHLAMIDAIFGEGHSSAGSICPHCNKYRPTKQYLDGLMLYAYQESNPLNRIDPGGLDCRKKLGGGCSGTCTNPEQHCAWDSGEKDCRCLWDKDAEREPRLCFAPSGAVAALLYLTMVGVARRWRKEHGPWPE